MYQGYGDLRNITFTGEEGLCEHLRFCLVMATQLFANIQQGDPITLTSSVQLPTRSVTNAPPVRQAIYVTDSASHSIEQTPDPDRDTSTRHQSTTTPGVRTQPAEETRPQMVGIPILNALENYVRTSVSEYLENALSEQRRLLADNPRPVSNGRFTPDNVKPIR